MIIAGSDPGKHGAVSFIDTERCLFWTYDMPIQPVGRGDRWRVDAKKLHRLFKLHQPEYAYNEDVWSLPTDGHVGAFMFGAASGVLNAISEANDCVVVDVRPQKWKAAFRLNSSKADSINMAKQLIPESDRVLIHKKDDGRAESLLIAFYGALDIKTRFKEQLKFGGLNGEKIVPSTRLENQPDIAWNLGK